MFLHKIIYLRKKEKDLDHMETRRHTPYVLLNGF